MIVQILRIIILLAIAVPTFCMKPQKPLAHYESLLQLGLLYAKQNDYENAFTYLAQVMEQSDSPLLQEEALKHLHTVTDQLYTRGENYLFGDEVTQDFQKAFKIFQLLAEQGFNEKVRIKAMHRLAQMYEKGQGISKNKHKATEYYQQISQQTADPYFQKEAQKKLQQQKK